MILLLLFDAGVTSEEVIPDHEYWISFMVQYQKEKEYDEKILTCHAVCMLNRDEKGFIFICSFYFSFCWKERVSVAYQSAGAGGLRMGWRMMVQREELDGSPWSNLS